MRCAVQLLFWVVYKDCPLLSWILLPPFPCISPRCFLFQLSATGCCRKACKARKAVKAARMFHCLFEG